MSTKSSFKSPFELLYCEKPKLHDNLKMFGEVGVVTTREKIWAKLSNRGTTCMFVGYTEHHSRDVYRILNLTTNSIINSLDIIWLNKTYKECKQNKTIFNVEDDILELPTGVNKVRLTENATKKNEDENNKLDKKVFRDMRKLESWFNPEAFKEVEDYSHGREMTLDKVNLALFSTVTVKEPTTYQEEINSEKKEDQIKWKSAINKELKEMEKRGVWEIIDEKNIPINRQCIKNKWMFTVKRNGIFLARLVACGYSQVPGIDFSESFAPVLNDVSF
jgi:hypothetical protein